MKYLTLDWHGAYTVKNWFEFIRTAEEWEEYDAELSQETKEERIAYQNSPEHRVIEESEKQLLKKYLPPNLMSFYAEIEDIVLRRGYPNPELKKLIDDWVQDPTKEYERLIDQTHEHFMLIKDQLPSVIVNELLKETLHDCKVLSIETPFSDKMVMTLSTGEYTTYKYMKLTFTGIEELVMPEQVLQNFWMHEEVYPTSSGFELHVLFSYPACEFKVVAKDLEVEEYGRNLQYPMEENK